MGSLIDCQRYRLASTSVTVVVGIRPVAVSVTYLKGFEGLTKEQWRMSDRKVETVPSAYEVAYLAVEAS